MSVCVLIGGLSACGAALPAAGSDYVRTTAGAYVLSDAPPGIVVRLGSKQVLNQAAAATINDRMDH
jgi:hypothetical protein